MPRATAARRPGNTTMTRLAAPLLSLIVLESVAATTGPATTRPADAVVLFDGTAATEAANWTGRHDHKPAAWPVADGAMTSDKQDIVSNQTFRDFTLHVEFCEPVMGPEVKGQQRGNSGVYLQGRYEIQVLDSFGLTPTPGDCGAIYNQKAPDVNACLPPGQWQTYDITFHAATYDADGKTKTAKARVTVVQNGQTIQKDVEINHPTGSELLHDGPADGPILLQYHHNGVQFRNVWIVPHG
jgi:hypothetical protein